MSSLVDTVDGREVVCVDGEGTEVYGHSVHILLGFAVNLKLPEKTAAY